VSAVAECDFVRGVFIGMHLGCWNVEVCISVTVLIYSI
jgi:hypothetical protein